MLAPGGGHVGAVTKVDVLERWASRGQMPSLKAVHPLKAYLPISGRLGGSVISLKDVQLQKA